MLETVANIKTQLSIAGDKHDALLTALSRGVSTWLANECDRTLERAADIVERHHGGAVVLSLKTYPVESVTDIRQDVEGVFGADTILDSDQYVLRSDAGLVYARYGPFLSGVMAIRVKYTGGYVAAGTAPSAGQTAVPDDLKMACRLTVADLFQRRDELSLTAQSVAGSSVSIQGAIKMLPLVKAVVAKYRRMAL
tara:strand:+ start:736 stop:1320 length:585 start_codon:yes stop_codon:yes gene_type:complete